MAFTGPFRHTLLAPLARVAEGLWPLTSVFDRERRFEKVLGVDPEILREFK